MLQITVPEIDFFDEDKQEFVLIKSETFQIEHSLVSISKWESKWEKPFDGSEKTHEQTIDYIRCMTITKNLPSSIYDRLTNDMLERISKYIDAPMTATWFNEQSNNKSNKQVVTAEIIYYLMIANNIPMECQKWHLNRLLTLIRVCNIKNSPPKKMKKNEMLSQRRTLNDVRRNQMNSKG